MEIKITMVNGKEYEIDDNIENFIATTKNQLGILINGFIELENGIYINPNHIVEILVIKEEENIQELNTEAFIDQEDFKPEEVKVGTGVLPYL